MTIFDENRQKPSKIVNFFPLTLTDGPYVQIANSVDVNGRSNICKLGIDGFDSQKPSKFVNIIILLFIEKCAY